jgi:hypothetical protein
MYVCMTFYFWGGREVSSDWVHLARRPSGLLYRLYQPRLIDDHQCGAAGGMRIGRMTWDWTRATMGNRLSYGMAHSSNRFSPEQFERLQYPYYCWDLWISWDGPGAMICSFMTNGILSCIPYILPISSSNLIMLVLFVDEHVTFSKFRVANLVTLNLWSTTTPSNSHNTNNLGNM